MASRLPFRSSVKAPKAKIDMSTIELEEDNEGGLILACHRRASQLSHVSDIRDSIKDWMDGSIVTEPTRTGNFEDHYQFGTTLHQSEWTRVLLCTHKATKQQRIVKVIKETCSYCHEYEMLSKLDHPSFPVFYELFKVDKEEQEFYMVLRYYPGGSLEEVLQDLKDKTGRGENHLSERHARQAIWQILVAINYLHHQNIVHCNLRPDNVLLRRANKFHSLTVVNFTSSFTKEVKKMNYIRGDYAGTDIVHLAPEILQDVPSYDEKADIWSCGVILFRLLSNTLPFIYFDSDTEEEIRQRILHGDLLFPDVYWRHISRETQAYIRLLLEVDPNRRPSAEEALQHVWLANVRKEIHNLTSNRNSHSLDILHNLQMLPAASQRSDSQHTATLVLKLRQAICALMVSRLLTNDQTFAMDEIFSALDTNYTGKILPKQLSDGYQQVFCQTFPEEILEKIWQQFDLASSGELGYSEFKVAAFGTQDWLTTGRIKETFEHLDKHNKGSISVVELTQAGIFKKAHIKEEDIVSVMEMVDLSGSGLVSFHDFRRVMKLEFLDTDVKEQQFPSLLEYSRPK